MMCGFYNCTEVASGFAVEGYSGKGLAGGECSLQCFHGALRPDRKQACLLYQRNPVAKIVAKMEDGSGRHARPLDREWTPFYLGGSYGFATAFSNPPNQPLVR